MLSNNNLILINDINLLHNRLYIFITYYNKRNYIIPNDIYDRLKINNENVLTIHNNYCENCLDLKTKYIEILKQHKLLYITKLILIDAINYIII